MDILSTKICLNCLYINDCPNNSYCFLCDDELYNEPSNDKRKYLLELKYFREDIYRWYKYKDYREYRKNITALWKICNRYNKLKNSGYDFVPDTLMKCLIQIEKCYKIKEDELKDYLSICDEIATQFERKWTR